MWSPIHTETHQNILSLSSLWPSGWYCAIIVTVCPAPFSAAAACSWDAPRRSMPFTWKRGSQRTLALCKACYSDVCSVAPSCLTLCDPMDSSQPGSSVHRIFQDRAGCHFLLQRIFPTQVDKGKKFPQRGCFRWCYLPHVLPRHWNANLSNFLLLITLVSRDMKFYPGRLCRGLSGLKVLSTQIH